MLDECTEPTQHRLERSERIGRVPCDFEDDPRTTAEGRFGVLLRCCQSVKHVDFYIYHVLTRSGGVGHRVRGQPRVSDRFPGVPFSRDPLSGGIEKTSEVLLPRDPGDVAEWQSRGGGRAPRFLSDPWIVGVAGSLGCAEPLPSPLMAPRPVSSPPGRVLLWPMRV